MGAWTRPNVRKNVKELVVRNNRHQDAHLLGGLTYAHTAQSERVQCKFAASSHNRRDKKKQRVSTKEEAASGEAQTREIMRLWR